VVERNASQWTRRLADRGPVDDSSAGSSRAACARTWLTTDEFGFAPSTTWHPAAAPARGCGLRAPPPRLGLALAVQIPGRIVFAHTTAVSLLDRLLHHTVVVAGGENLRIRGARTRGTGRQSKP
jgi:hypothetical protein